MTANTHKRHHERKKKEWRHLSCDMWVVWSKHDTSHQSALGISLCIFNQHGNGKKIWRSANYTVNFSLLFSCFTPRPAQVAPILKPTTNHLRWWPHKLFSLFFSFVCIHRNVADHLNYKWPAVRVRRVVDEDDLTNKEVTYTFMLWGEPSKKK